MDAARGGRDDRTIEDLITQLVLSRMTVVGLTNPELAHAYGRLAAHGEVNPALYASVLRFAGQAGTIRGGVGRPTRSTDAA